METKVRGSWNQRRFVAVGAGLSGLALPATGLADHLAGKSDDSPGWTIVHTSLGSAFVVFATWHCILNRRALLRYMRGSVASRAQGPGIRRERSPQAPRRPRSPAHGRLCEACRAPPQRHRFRRAGPLSLSRLLALRRGLPA